MGRFIFYFASQAYFDERRGKNGAFPLQGVKSYGDLAHKYKIPVTWLTNAEGLRRGKEVFEQFHFKYGDDCILFGLPFQGENTSAKRDFAIKMSEEEIYSYLKKELAEMKAICEWVRTDHIGYFYRTLPAVRAMQKLGIKSCYGHCWELIATDGVTDNGVPWGFYYIDSETSWKRPSKGIKGIVANEWLQHDLNKCWNYYGSSSVFSWDPNDVERAKICDWRNIEYWKEGFREYYRNRYWNAFIPFVFHQEAHEQESTPGGWEVYPPETVQNTYEMTDEFLKFITSGEFPDMEIMSLANCVEEYIKAFDRTQSTYMLFKDIPVNSPIWLKRKQEVFQIFMDAKKDEEEEGGTLDPVKDYEKLKYLFNYYGWQGMLYEKEFPESLVVVSSDGQFFFHRDSMLPKKIWNYNKKIESDPKNLYFNENIFETTGLDKIKSEFSITAQQNALSMNMNIISSTEAPFGIAIWESSLIKEFNNEREISVKINEVPLETNGQIKLIPKNCLVILFNLSAGNTAIKITKKFN